MNVPAINAVNAQTVNVNLKPQKVEEEFVQPDLSGYEEVEAAPTNAALYQSMYGIEETAETEAVVDKPVVAEDVSETQNEEKLKKEEK